MWKNNVDGKHCINKHFKIKSFNLCENKIFRTSLFYT